MIERKKVRELVKKYEANNWDAFLDSDDDYAVRGFIGHLESAGYLARIKIVDLKLVHDGMGALIIDDWTAMEPAVKYYRTIWKTRIYDDFEWLKDSVLKERKKQGIRRSPLP
jgi:hypothetical protein